MARVSKYEQKQEQFSQWNAGVYIRLSREDGDRMESESTLSQRAIIEHYLNERSEIKVIDYYTDDGWSGTDFERPAFKKLFADITARRINCIVVKDLSRFGRNYIESGKYLETIFPLFKVRFIAINDGIDNIENPSSVNSIMLPFKNIINDEYCRDISIKVRSSLTARRFQGKFIGSFPSYGYKKDPLDHNKLIIDEDSSKVVRLIFDSFLSGTSIIGITRNLNALGIENPSAYKASIGLKCKNTNTLWTDRTVRRMLSNRIYVGDMVQKKYEVISYKIHVGRKTQESEWIVVLNTHDPIIGREEFEKVQSLLKRDTRISPVEGKLSLFAGFVKCADCGRAMNKKSVVLSNKKYEYYVCSTYRRSSHLCCTKHTIRSDILENAVIGALNGYIQLAVDYEKLSKLIKENDENKNETKNLQTCITAKKSEINELNTRLVDLYPDYKEGILSKDCYFALKEKYENKLTQLKSALRRLEEEIDNLSTPSQTDDFVESLKKYGGFKYLTREILVELIDNVFVHEGGALDVRLKFKDSLTAITEYLEQNKIKVI